MTQNHVKLTTSRSPLVKSTLNYPETIAHYDLTHMMNMIDHVTIGMKTLRIDSGCSSIKDFTELICINPWIVLYLTIYQVDSCYGCVYNHLTWDNKDILWIDDLVLIMIYESLATRSLKHHLLDMTLSPQRWLCGQDWIICPQYLRMSTQRMRCDEILSKGGRNLIGVSSDFLHASVLTWVINLGLIVDHTLWHSWGLCK